MREDDLLLVGQGFCKSEMHLWFVSLCSEYESPLPANKARWVPWPVKGWDVVFGDGELAPATLRRKRRVKTIGTESFALLEENTRLDLQICKYSLYAQS